MRIRPFQGLRPTPESAPRIASPPYDVVTTEEARQLAAGNPLSMLRVVRAEIDFPPGTDPSGPPVYARAVANFRALADAGHLVREPHPCLYLYQLQRAGHAQQGIVAVCHVDDYAAGRIRRHENTRTDKEDDRTRLTDALGADAEPVFLTYRDDPALGALARAAAAGPPLHDLTAPDGVRHTVWRIAGGAAVVDAFARVPCCYIADGHHRSASAARVGLARRAANPRHTGAEDYNWFLGVLFPASQLRVLPYNRLVRDLAGLDPAAFTARLAAAAPLAPAASGTPERPGDVRCYCAGRWHRLTLAPDPGADPVHTLDVAMLQHRVLAPLLGIDDPQTSDRIDFVGGARGTGPLQAAVDAGHAAAAFSMFPVQLDQLLAIADAGQIMPPKSTWFEPKLRSGFFIHTF